MASYSNCCIVCSLEKNQIRTALDNKLGLAKSLVRVALLLFQKVPVDCQSYRIFFAMKAFAGYEAGLVASFVYPAK